MGDVVPMNETMIEEEFDLKKQDIGYKQVLMRHLDRMSNISTYFEQFIPITTGGVPEIQKCKRTLGVALAVEFLDSTLEPYKDQEFKGDKAEKNEFIDRLTGIKGFSVIFGKYKKLIRLMARKNLLLEEDVSLDVKKR